MNATRIIDVCLVIWCAISVLFWFAYSFATRTYFAFVVYYPIWVGIFGALMWRDRVQIAKHLLSWRVQPSIRFVVLGYGTVLLEEIFAALANHLSEGFSPLVYLARIGQFWALNIFAFAGFITGWLILTKFLEYSPREIFYLSGLWGLYAEKIIFAIPVNPAFFLFSAVPTMFTYGLIITPAMLSQKRIADLGRWPPFLKYPLTYLVIFLCSVVPVLILSILRNHWPSLFPPVNLVPA
jgi:hypothetical protein